FARLSSSRATLRPTHRRDPRGDRAALPDAARAPLAGVDRVLTLFSRPHHSPGARDLLRGLRPRVSKEASTGIARKKVSRMAPRMACRTLVAALLVIAM